MAVLIGAKPDCGFDDPIGMLKDCHRRIERFLRILWLVEDRASGRALSAEEKSAVRSAMNYFQLGGKRHTADEEESLFPRMRVHMDGELSPDESSQIGSLEHDHQIADDLHKTVDALYGAWIDADRLVPEDERKLRDALEEMKKLYEAHIKIEEDIVFPRAAQILDSQCIAAIGDEIRQRRENASLPEGRSS